MSHTSLENQFQDLADTWQNETMLYSMPHQILGHPNYQILKDMGDEILPLIFQRQQTRPEKNLSIGWLHMLHEITGEIPVSGEQVAPGFIGVSIPQMNRAWENWARENGYL